MIEVSAVMYKIIEIIDIISVHIVVPNIRYKMIIKEPSLLIIRAEQHFSHLHSNKIMDLPSYQPQIII